jgi:hypothetical protein
MATSAYLPFLLQHLRSMRVIALDKQCTPHPLKTCTDHIVLTGARERIAKKAYIRAIGYPAVHFDDVLNKLKDNPGWTKHELQCGHDAMLDMPQEVADLLVASA